MNERAADESFRNTGDYGGIEHVTAEQASEAIEEARRILDAVNRCLPS